MQPAGTDILWGPFQCRYLYLHSTISSHSSLNRMSCNCAEIIESAQTGTGCVCPTSGFCDRHQCEKTARFHMLCRDRPDYFALWESGAGPCMGKYVPAAPNVPRGVPHLGLGDLTAVVIRLLTFGQLKPWPGCQCSVRKAWLNRVVVWGWWRK